MDSIAHLATIASQIQATIAARIPPTITPYESRTLTAITAAQAAAAAAVEAQNNAANMAALATHLCVSLLSNASMNAECVLPPFLITQPPTNRLPISATLDAYPFTHPLSAPFSVTSSPSRSRSQIYYHDYSSSSSSAYSPPSHISSPANSPPRLTLQQRLDANASDWAANRTIYVQNARFQIGRLEGEDGEGNEAIRAVTRRLAEKLEWAGGMEREEAIRIRRMFG